MIITLPTCKEVQGEERSEREGKKEERVLEEEEEEEEEERKKERKNWEDSDSPKEK